MSRDIRLLLLADSHLGYDLPLRPRVDRRRRGHDFLANYSAALAPAFIGGVDLVVHAGDVFDRPMVAASVAYQALEPLRRIADRGVPVFIVPGNHERSRIPHRRFASHPGIHVFDAPRTFVADVRGTTIALAGFPYVRENVRARFGDTLDQTRWRAQDAAVRVLCIHHCVEGATVGPGDFTFTSADDVIRARDIPSGFAAVLSGHIHRHQVLMRDLSGRPLASPVLYPGSIERTSLAEIDEPKGFLLVRVGASDTVRWQFRRLPARPMIQREIVAGVPDDAVVSIRVSGPLTAAHWRVMSAARLRRVVPDTMNVEIRPAGQHMPRTARGAAVAHSSQLSLYELISPST